MLSMLALAAALAFYTALSFAPLLMPERGEPFVYQTNQFDRILRKRGIENLVYAGFATDMCILRSPGGSSRWRSFPTASS